MFIERKKRNLATLAKPEIRQPLTVDRASECHITPAPVAARMASYLGPLKSGKILEPSAGTGALLQALLDVGTEPQAITAIERHNKLASALSFEGVTVRNCCFLEYAADTGERFEKIIMNPPFSKVRQHMKAALALLDKKEGAALVALVPITFQHEDAQTLEELDENTFATAKVRTKIILIEAMN